MPRKLEYNATLVQRTEISPGLLVIRVVPDRPLFDFTPGQYTVLGLKRKEPRCDGADEESDELLERDPEEVILRAYSIASSSLEREHLDIYLALVGSGELTPRLFALDIGARLYLGPKATGMFTLEQVPRNKHIALVSTGTGLGPYISMLRTYLPHHAHRTFLILHGARYSWDLGYRDELVMLSRLCPHLKYIPVVSRPNQDAAWRGHTGYVQNYLEDDFVRKMTYLPLSPQVFEVFLCGNPAMIEQAAAHLQRYGFEKDSRKQKGTIHVEEYW